MLRGIHPLLSGELLAALDRLGHGDELIIADRNFPAYSVGCPVIRIAESDSAVLAAVIVGVVPLDDFVEEPLRCMVADSGPVALTARQREVATAASRVEGREIRLGTVPRTEFYRVARAAALVIQTLESEPYCDFILTKGVVRP